MCKYHPMWEKVVLPSKVEYVINLIIVLGIVFFIPSLIIYAEYFK